MDKKIMFYSIVSLGTSSIITQIVLIREFLSVFYGNEIIFGIILANWLLLTGAGAYLGKFSGKINKKINKLIFFSLVKFSNFINKEKINIIIMSQFFLAFFPFFSVFLIRVLKNTIFQVGSLVGVLGVFASSLILLLPYCILSGFLFTLFCSIYSDKSFIGRVYFLDSIGSIVGGALFSFIFVYFFNSFQSMYFVMVINLTAALLLSTAKGKIALRNVAVFLGIASILFIVVDFNKISISMQYKGQEVLLQKDTPYGNIVVTKNAGQVNFFENGIELFSAENTALNEETVHYAMLQHDNPKEILLISGGISGTTNEIVKYNIDRVDYVELDPFLTRIGKEYTKNLNNEKINIINKDARLFVKETGNMYDVVIVDLPSPSNSQLNRFYTAEFFYELKKKLNKNAVVSLSLESTKDYISKEAASLNSVLYNTLKNSFNNVIIIPGNKNYFLASDDRLTYSISERIKEKNINTKYVNKDYLKGELTQERVSYLMSSIDKNSKLNKDFSPVTYYYHLLYWMSYFKFNYVFFLAIIFALMLLFLIRVKPIAFAVFATGFGASSLEVILLICFQIVYGYVYNMVGIIITAFMLGLAIGSFCINKNLEKKNIKNLIKLQFSIAFYSVLLPFVIIFLAKTGALLEQILFFVLTLIIGIMTGMEFPLASKVYHDNITETAARIYNADLIGASAGALLVSALLIPLIGIVNVCVLIGVLDLVSGLVLVMEKKKVV